MTPFVALLFILSTCLHADETLIENAKRCRRILQTSLVDYYLPACVELPDKGYLENWRSGQFVSIGEKSLVMQARQLWFFSSLQCEGIEADRAREAAKCGFAFLENHMRDRQHGGYFSKVTDSGAPKDKRKHLYMNAFALYGLAAYSRATNDPEALAAAKELFWTLEEKAYDRRFGGFLEFFTEDWIPITHRNTDTPVGFGDIKTYNTHLHVMEALTELYRIWPDPALKARLHEILVINTKTIRHPHFPCNLNEWNFHWSPIQTANNYRVHFGHELECSWLAMEAVRVLGEPVALYSSLSESFCRYCLEYGFDFEHGGFFYAGPVGAIADDRKKEWWVQAEALVALLEMYQQTKKTEYYTAFQKTLSFVETYQLAPGGGWWATCRADGSPSNLQRSSGWQGAYHNGRALLRCMNILETLDAIEKRGGAHGQLSTDLDRLSAN